MQLQATSMTYSREGNGPPLQYYCLDNPIDGGAWKATVHGIAKSWTQLSNFTFTLWIHRSCRYRRIFTRIYNIGAKGSKKLSIKDRFLFYLLSLKFILWGNKKLKEHPYISITYLKLIRAY